MKAVLGFTLLFMFGLWLGVFIIKHSKKVEVEHVSASVQPGFASQPGQWNLTASPAYKWANGNKGIVWLGYVLIAVFFLFAWFQFDNDKGSPTITVIVGIVLAYLFVFGKEATGYYDKKGFKISISEEQYEANKGDLIKLFP